MVRKTTWSIYRCRYAKREREIQFSRMLSKRRGIVVYWFGMHASRCWRYNRFFSLSPHKGALSFSSSLSTPYFFFSFLSAILMCGWLMFLRVPSQTSCEWFTFPDSSSSSSRWMISLLFNSSTAHPLTHSADQRLQIVKRKERLSIINEKARTWVPNRVGINL